MQALNALMHAVHLAIIGFCLAGWAIPGLLPWHLLLCLLTLASWFVLGFMIKKPGFCLITGIQQKLRKNMKDSEDMGNYMHFLAGKITGKKFSASKIDILTQAFLYTLTILSVILNVKRGVIF